MTSKIPSSPGLLFANSGIKQSQADTLSPTHYAQVYKDRHIQDIIDTGSLHSASFYKAAGPKTDLPFLVLYHFDDLAHALNKVIPNVPMKYKELPGSGLLPALANFDMRNYVLKAHNNPKGVEFGKAPILTAVYMTPTEKVSVQDIEDWYSNEHFPFLNDVPGYVGSKRYRIAPESSTLPPVLIVHEFEGVEVYKKGSAGQKALQASTATEWANKVLGGAKVESKTFKLDKFFDGKAKSRM